MPTLVDISPQQLQEMRRASAGTSKSAVATAAPSDGSYDNDAELWQMLNAGKAEDNPYLPYLTPRVVTGSDGKKYLRIPKNQELLNLGKFFDERGQQQYDNSSKFVNDYLGWKDSQTKLGLEAAKTEYAINKPYYKPTSGDGDAGTPAKALAVSNEKTSTGGLAFFEKQKDGTKKPITAADYAGTTGQNIIDILSQSNDPADKKIIEDTKNLEADIANGVVTVDEALAALQEDYPHVYGSRR